MFTKFVRRVPVARIAIILAAVAGLGLLSETSAQAQAPGVYRVSTVTGFQQTTGNFAAQNLARVRGMLLQINANGTYVLYVPDTWYNTMSGRLVANQGGRTFTGVRTFRTQVGYNWAEIQGAVGVRNGQVVMAISSRSGNIMGAVINSSRFGSSTSNAYVAVATLQKIR